MNLFFPWTNTSNRNLSSYERNRARCPTRSPQVTTSPRRNSCRACWDGRRSITKNKDPHDRSDSAYDMLEEYVIGGLGTVRTQAALYQKKHSWSNIDQILRSPNASKDMSRGCLIDIVVYLKHYMASIISFSCTSSSIAKPFCGVTCGEVGYEYLRENVGRHMPVPTGHCGDQVSPP